MKTKIRLLLGAGLSLLVTFGLNGKAELINSENQVPQGLSASDWSGIRAEHERQSHAIVLVADRPNTWQARNPRQQWRTTFDARGFLNRRDEIRVLNTIDAGGFYYAPAALLF